MSREFTPEFKVKVVLESFQRDTTLDAVARAHQLNRSVLNRWRTEFKDRSPDIFADRKNPSNRARAQGFEPGQSPEDLKKLIGELAVQNEILKKAEGLWGSGLRRK
jgi:transposase